MIDAGAEVWASDLTARLHRERGREQLDSLADDFTDDPLGEELRSTRVRDATRTFPINERQTLPIEGERVEIIHPGAAHAKDNVVTHFVDRGVVFAGCMCFSANRTGMGYIGDADVDAWPAALEAVQTYDDTRRVIALPGALLRWFSVPGR